MIPWIAFSLGSIPLILVSWTSLHHPDSHGFYRFFAWEAILAIFVINATKWFGDWLAWNQIISWILLIASVIPVAIGTYQLRTRGKPDPVKRPDPGLVGYERTTRLVSSGIYKYMRHPLYCSLLLLTWGAFFKALTQTGITLALLSTLFLYATAKADESECIQVFGTAYQEYMKRTKMFIPYII
ncbi:MAG TPA: isoprenylcysteine carboxylmethyltransferase family protein [Anaerolineales bacterium]|nr:isoprenylcysteine carboxylmethyltransferase family protein [Anaerolineales bacterium]